MRALVLATVLLGVTGCSGDEFSASGRDAGSSSSGGSSSGGTDGGGMDGGALGSGGRSSDGGASSGGAGAGGRGSGGAGDGGGTGAGGSEAGGSGGAAAGGAGAGGLASGGAGPGGAGGAAAGGAGAGGAPGVLTSCPHDPPDPSVECRGDFRCTYGTDPRPSCRSEYKCNGQVFLVTTPRCTAPRSCLTDFTPLPVVGGACEALGDSCTWDSGLTCACVPCDNGQQDCIEWYCYPGPSAPCPLVPPNQGQPCEASTAAECSYAFCGAPEYVVARCSGGASGTWSWDASACN